MTSSYHGHKSMVKAKTEVADQAEGSARRNVVGNAGSKAGRPHLKQSLFNCLAKEKNNELTNFETEVIFSCQQITI